MKDRKGLVVFIIVTLTSGWLGVIINRILNVQTQEESLGMGLWLVLPLLTAIILRTVNHDWKDAGIKFYFRKNWKWYLVAVFIYPSSMILSVLIAIIFGMVEFKQMSFGTYLSIIMLTIPGNIIKNIFEEFSWRGYLAPKLIALKLNDWMIYLITGFVWSFWHAAYYLVFLPDTYFEETTRFNMLMSGWLIMTGWSIMFVEIRRLTNSVWPCLIMHTIEEAVPTALVTIGGYVVFSQSHAVWFDPIFGIIVNVFLVIIGLLLRTYRIKREHNIISD